MVEFPEIMLPASSEDILRRLIAHGINTVITHPERNNHLRRDLDRMADWVAIGCLIQVTAQALNRSLRERRARKCLGALEERSGSCGR